MAAIRLALDGVARKVATPVPRPVTPVAIGTVTVMAAVPSNATPLMLRAVARAVAVLAFPVSAPMNVVTVRAFVAEL